MLKFSLQEFDIMIDELLNQETPRYDMLCHIAEKVLSNKVRSWCSRQTDINGIQYFDDVMSAIYMRLILKSITGFILKNGPDGEINYDPDGFQSWIFRVAKNSVATFFYNLRRNLYSADSLDIPESKEPSYEDPDYELIQERRDLLNAAFALVMSLDISVYKILTWIAEFVFIWHYSLTKIEANHLLEKWFSVTELFEMYNMVRDAAHKIPWLKLSDEQHQNMLAALNEKREEDGRVYGTLKYNEVFMKKGGVASMSDWMNRINNTVRSKLGNGTFEA